MLAVQTYADANGVWQVGELAEGADAYVFAKAAERRVRQKTGGLCVFVARDDARATAFRSAVEFFAPKIPVMHLPAWDVYLMTVFHQAEP